MKRFETEQIRNIALAGHGGTGKTSLGEAMLFVAKGTTRLGSVDAGTSTFDYEPEEIRRKTTYASGVASIEWGKAKVNIVDTPGDSVFAADTRLCMMATDLTVLLVSAIDQIEVGADRAWTWAEELGCPRLIYVAKMDKERADFDKTLAVMREEWGTKVAPLQIPIGAEGAFEGVVDLLNMRAHTYPADGSGQGVLGDIPADLVDIAAAAREELIEAVASADDALLEKFFEEGELSEEEVRGGLKKAVANGTLIPVVCGSATRNLGTDTLLDAIVDVGPSPADVQPPSAVDGEGNPVAIRCDSAAPLAAVVFKSSYLEMGKVCFLRVFQGKGDPDQYFYNADREEKERWGQVLAPFGKKLDSIPGAACGDIFAVAKLKETVAGHVLCADKQVVRIQTPPIPQPCISYALRAKKKGDEDKVATGLSRVLESDPSLRTSRDPQTKDHLLSGMGQTHIEVAVEKMRRFGAEVELLPPHVAYREAIRGAVEKVEGKHKKQSGGRGQFGVCYLDMSPAERGEGLVFENAIFGGSIPGQFVPAVEKGVRDAMTHGVIAGFPVVDVKVRLVDGKYHSVDSDGRSFEIAGRKGFREAFMKCSPTLLEPVMIMDVTVPDECRGDVMGDITARRGRVQGMEARGTKQVVKALVPQSEVLEYAPNLRSLSGGRGSFTITFSHYEEVPGNLVEKIVAERKVQHDDD